MTDMKKAIIRQDNGHQVVVLPEGVHLDGDEAFVSQDAVTGNVLLSIERRASAWRPAHVLRGAIRFQMRRGPRQRRFRARRTGRQRRPESFLRGGVTRPIHMLDTDIASYFVREAGPRLRPNSWHSHRKNSAISALHEPSWCSGCSRAAGGTQFAPESRAVPR